MSQTAPHDFLTLDDIFNALGRRWFRIVGLTCLITAVAAAALVSIPNRYQSDALLYVRMGRGTVSLDPASTAAGQTIALMDKRQSEINSVREMLKSRIVMERAVRSVGVERVLEHDAWWDTGLELSQEWIKDSLNVAQDKYLGQRLVGKESTPDGFTPEEFEAQKDLELAIKRLSKSFSISSAKESYTLGLFVRAFEPGLARDLCQAIVTEYRRVHVDAHSLEGSLQFFEEEFALCETRLNDLEATLRDEKNRASMMTVSIKQDLIHREILQLQSDRIKASSELAATQGRDVELASKIRVMPEKLDLEKTAGSGNAATDSMRNQLFELEMMEKDLTGKYAADHPLVVQVTKKLKEARAIYGGQDKDRVLSRQAINPIRQELELDRLRNLSAMEGWRAQVDEIDGKLKLAQSGAAQLNFDELKINELERSVQLARNDVLTYGRKREEARLLKQLDVGNFSDISVPQPPTTVYKHVAPQRSLLLLASGAGGFLLSCFLAVWRGTGSRGRTKGTKGRSSSTEADATKVTTVKAPAALAQPREKRRQSTRKTVAEHTEKQPTETLSAINSIEEIPKHEAILGNSLSISIHS